MKIKMVLILAILIPLQSQAFFWGQENITVAEAVQVESGVHDSIRINLVEFANDNGENFMGDPQDSEHMIHFYDIGALLQKYIEENQRLRHVFARSKVKEFRSDFILEAPYGKEIYYQIVIEESSLNQVRAYVYDTTNEKYLAGTKAQSEITRFSFRSDVERILKNYIADKGITLELEISPIRVGDNQ